MRLGLPRAVAMNRDVGCRLPFVSGLLREWSALRDAARTRAVYRSIERHTALVSVHRARASISGADRAGAHPQRPGPAMPTSPPPAPEPPVSPGQFVDMGRPCRRWDEREQCPLQHPRGPPPPGPRLPLQHALPRRAAGLIARVRRRQPLPHQRRGMGGGHPAGRPARPHHRCGRSRNPQALTRKFRCDRRRLGSRATTTSPLFVSPPGL
jgi:hypothetical protein